MRKIAVFHWGQMSIHTYYMVEQLAMHHIRVVLYVYSPPYLNYNSFGYKLIEEIKQICEVVEIRARLIESFLIKLNRVSTFIRTRASVFCINPLLPARTRPLFRSGDYDALITVAHASLFWLFKLDRESLSKTLHYSLEIFTIHDPEISKTSCLYGLINSEKTLLQKVAGLIIQDESRANIIFPKAVRRQNQEIIYMPVSIPGRVATKKSSYLHQKLQIPTDKVIVLYFGAWIKERKINELVSVFSDLDSARFTLVLHGDDAFKKISGLHANVRISRELLPFNEIDEMVASAKIGIAFYDNGWPNTRLTAFSSEKIARYTKAGVPFLAIANDSYIKLQKEFFCCQLITNFSDIPGKLQLITADYERYSNECFKAYEKYYNVETTIKPLVQYIKSV